MCPFATRTHIAPCVYERIGLYGVKIPSGPQAFARMQRQDDRSLILEALPAVRFAHQAQPACILLGQIEIMVQELILGR